MLPWGILIPSRQFVVAVMLCVTSLTHAEPQTPDGSAGTLRGDRAWDVQSARDKMMLSRRVGGNHRFDSSELARNDVAKTSSPSTGQHQQRNFPYAAKLAAAASVNSSTASSPTVAVSLSPENSPSTVVSNATVPESAPTPDCADETTAVSSPAVCRDLKRGLSIAVYCNVRDGTALPFIRDGSSQAVSPLKGKMNYASEDLQQLLETGSDARCRDHYILNFFGYIQPSEDGAYRLMLVANATSAIMLVDGKEVVRLDQGKSQQEFDVEMTAGSNHSIQVQYLPGNVRFPGVELLYLRNENGQLQNVDGFMQCNSTQPMSAPLTSSPPTSSVQPRPPCTPKASLVAPQTTTSNNETQPSFQPTSVSSMLGKAFQSPPNMVKPTTGAPKVGLSAPAPAELPPTDQREITPNPQQPAQSPRAYIASASVTPAAQVPKTEAPVTLAPYWPTAQPTVQVSQTKPPVVAMPPVPQSIAQAPKTNSPTTQASLLPRPTSDAPLTDAPNESILVTAAPTSVPTATPIAATPQPTEPLAARFAPPTTAAWSSCPGIDSWTAEEAAQEAEMLRLVNVARSANRNCGSKGSFPAVPPVAFDPQLQCAARRHAKDMADRQYFNHNTQGSGQTAGERIESTGYKDIAGGENIAAGPDLADVANAGFMRSDGHCANIMNKDYNQLAIGCYKARGKSQYTYYWVQDYGTIRV